MSYLPPPGPPPPGPPPAPKPRRNLRTVLIVVGAVLLVCCGGAGVGGFFLVRGFFEGTQPMRDAVHEFLGDIEEGDYAGAYGQLCDSYQDTRSEAEFIRDAQSDGQLTDYRITGTSVSRNLGSDSTGEITVQLTFDGGEQVQGVFEMVEEDGDWKVCGTR